MKDDPSPLEAGHPPDITALSATRLAAEIRSGRLRSAEVTAAFLDRIARHDRRVRAVVALDPAGAHRQAQEADRAVAAGVPLGPLHGVPMTVKDGFRVAGLRSSFGLPYLRFYRPAADCEAVARLRRAGAVILSRTAVPFACFDWQCRPPLARECRNPLDPARTPGGSSGGAAAALAARFTPLELGTDVAGSIRYPAHCCGVYGLRTTVGLVPAGDIGPPTGKPLYSSVISVGPMARSVGDLGLLLSALLPDRDAREVTPAAGRLRVAVTPAVEGAPPDAGSAEAVRGFASRLADAGHEVTTPARPPFDFEVGYAVWGLVAGYEMKQVLPALLRNRLAMLAFAAWFLTYRLGDGPLTAHFRRGLLASEAEYREGLARRDELVRAVEAFLGRHDLWVLPASPGVAIRRQRPGRPIRTTGGPVPYSRFLGQYLCPTAVVGTPALVLPAGLGEGGLPVGVQVHGPRFADRWLVGVAGPHLAAVAIEPPLPAWER
jgi:amidase